MTNLTDKLYPLVQLEITDDPGPDVESGKFPLYRSVNDLDPTRLTYLKCNFKFLISLFWFCENMFHIFRMTLVQIPKEINLPKNGPTKVNF